MKNIFQFIKENETRDEDDVTQEEFLEALLEIEEELDEFELEESLDENVLGRYASAGRRMNKRDDAANNAVQAAGGKDPRTKEPTTPEEWMARREYHLKYAARNGMTQPMKDLISKKTMGIHKKSASECREIHNIITGTKMDASGNWKPNEKFAVREYPHSTPDHITREYNKKKQQYRKRLQSLQTSEHEDTKDLKRRTERPWYDAMKKHFASNGMFSDVPKPDPLDFGITWDIRDGKMPHRPYMESLDEKAPKIDLDKYAAHMNRNKKAVRKTSASQDYIKDVQKRSNKMGEAISMKNSNNQYYYQDPKGVVQAVGSKDAMRKMNIKQAKDGNKGGSFSMNHKKYKVGDQIKESVELNELSAEEKKLINTMYDKKGNLTPMGKKVMDHGKKNAVKESVELDEASEEGKIRVIDLSDAHPDNRMGAKEKSGYQVQRMTKGKFVNQGKPYKKYADAKKVQQGTGQHSMQFEEISGTGYELYHRDFSGAMGHAYAHAKKKFGITVDSDEIDDKVAMGPRKPGNGKTNTYRLKGDKGNIQVQVYNRGGSKPFELNMYKESVELDESKWEYQDARGVTKTGSLSKTVERQGTDVSYIFKGDDGKTDVVSGSRLKKMKKIKESVIDEAKTPELKGNPFKYYKKPTNKKEAQSNVNFWHYVGMADNDEIEDMGKIPANYKSYAKSMKQDAQRELKKMNEAVVLDEASLIPQLQTIVKDKQHAKIKGMIVDTFTASMITQIYSKVNDANKAKMDKLPLEKLVNIAHKMMKK